jgi:hypothetical protein
MQQLCEEATVQQPLLGNSSVDTFFFQSTKGNIIEETFAMLSVQLRVTVVRSEKLVVEAREISGAQIKRNVHPWKPLQNNG